MDFNDTPEEAAFRVEARAWLAANAPAFEVGAKNQDEQIKALKAWQRRKFDAGYAAITLPKAVGGRDGSAMQAVIWAQEEGRYKTPRSSYFGMGAGMAIPTLLAHGSPEQLARFAGPTLRGEIQWCQLFSEPGAGSDLAASRTRAVKDGDNWIVNGQKVWSSWAHLADWGMLLARSDSSKPKHEGLSYFVVDMKAPGIDVRPIRQIDGKSDFNETFLTDVVIPDSCRVGPVGGGWRCAMTTLMNERSHTGNAPETSVIELIRQARATHRGDGMAIDSAYVQVKLAQWYVEEQGIKNFNLGVMTKISKGQALGPEVAVLKLAAATKTQQMKAFEIDMSEFEGLFLSDETPNQNKLFDQYLWSVVMRIAGGADEVLRNQISERILNMPSEARIDKGVPFDSLPA